MRAAIFGAIFAGALALAVAAAPPLALASTAGGDDKKKEPEPPPDSEGHGAGMKKAEKNPLPEIIDLMRKVEERLADAETNQWTRAEQEKIVKALEGQQSAIEKLKDLIKQVEEQSQSGGGGGQQQKPQPGGGGQQQKPQARQEDPQQQPVDPQQQRKPGDQQPKDGKRTDEKQRQRNESSKPEDAKIDPKATSNAANQWGVLPEKKAHEVIDAKSRPMPAQYRKALEEYYRKLSEPKRN